jgi:hypothetical protein
MFSRDLVAALNANPERPWSVLKKGKKITELWLAQQLLPYGIQSRTIWIGENSPKGYLEEDFREVFRRYIPKSAVEALLEDARAAGREKPESGEKQPEGLTG